jgi:hypothetical protein
VVVFRYAAPEQLTRHVATTHADVFSFGVVLAEMIHPCGSFMEREQVLLLLMFVFQHAIFLFLKSVQLIPFVRAVL